MLTPPRAPLPLGPPMGDASRGFTPGGFWPTGRMYPREASPRRGDAFF